MDSSVVVSALTDSGTVGRWADSILRSGSLSAPHLILAEAASILRRGVAAGDLSADLASIAHADLLALRMELFPYAPFASRIWHLRSNVTAYDGWYVALAEFLESDLATVDLRLSRASGPQCGFLTPPAGAARP